MVIFLSACGQHQKKVESAANSTLQTYYDMNIGLEDSEANPQDYSKVFAADQRPKNVILLIGDGMGINQIMVTRQRFYGVDGKLFMESMPFSALINTHAALNDNITDSAAGATAMATGKKTRNGMLGVTADTLPTENLIEKCKRVAMSTGLITYGKLSGATPGAFASHVASRDMKGDISYQMLQTNFDFLFGDSEDFWGTTSDGKAVNRAFAESLGFHILENKNQLNESTDDKILALLSPLVMEDESIESGKVVINPLAPTLSDVTKKAMNHLTKNPKGFFLMVEEDWIDSWGHDNRPDFVTWHVRHLDEAVQAALNFALSNNETLVIVTADHETGGLTNIEVGDTTGVLRLNYSTDEHTGQPVPLFAFGPGANRFMGILDNTDIFRIISDLLALPDSE
ncbi:hypothetical protein APS56_15025 [Pseudalgibacter alginicilyticus]|uniref:Alkaline phosphatase n=2 Tax=Pseudalgibacter alginicilyticus TaxID=1736674 RepID=A0A0P0DE10_9FLAO|nr:hypothetical protein APS56_15025 [Pseudalgibacter alginicilyticus]